MSERKPEPMLVVAATKVVCPVCGKPSYSLSGMHPQCAVAKADVKSRDSLKAAAAAARTKIVKKSWASSPQKKLPAK